MKLKCILSSLIFVLMTFVSCQCSKNEIQSRPDTFALLFTTSVQGWVEPCGCTSEPLGGMPRLATVVLEANSRYGLGTMLIDGGDLLFDSMKAKSPADLCQERARVDLLLSSLHDLSCLGTFSGPLDDAMGVDFKEERLKKHQLKDLTSLAREGILQGSDSFKLGILFLDENNASSLDEKAIALKKKGAQATVAVTHLSRLKAKVLAGAVASLDVVVLATVGDEKPVSAERVGANGPIFVSAAKQGQYVGVVEFRLQDKTSSKWELNDKAQQKEARASLLAQRKKTLESQIAQTKDEQRLLFLNERLADIQSELKELEGSEQEAQVGGNTLIASVIALSRKIVPNEPFDVRLQSYEKQIPELVAQCEVNLECPTLAENQSSFVGADTCRNCHSAAYEFWTKAIYKVPATDEKGKAIDSLSGHAKAWETLEGKSKTKDRSCVECHSVGFMQPGGYCKVNEVGRLKGVQCESCHGAGSMHASTGNKRYINREVPESTCRGCHHVPHIATTESFVYTDKLQKILGQGHGELFLAKIKHESQH
jgi:hypothetical protein